MLTSIKSGFYQILKKQIGKKRLDKNEDGSVYIYFGPKAAKGKDKNWIPTNPGEGWFSYFRLYGPTQDHFDLTWVLPNIEKAE